MIDHDEMQDCCLLCIHWTPRKPKTQGEKFFWYCKKDIIESAATDDIEGIYEMAHPNRCRHYVRMVDPDELERLKRLKLSYGRHMPGHEAEKLSRLLADEKKASDGNDRTTCMTCLGRGGTSWPGDEEDFDVCKECCGDGWIESD